MLATKPLSTVPPFVQFISDITDLEAINANGPASIEATRRLIQGEEVFKFHKIFNGSAERTASQKLPVDIHHIYMLDNSLAHSFLSGKKLLNFIKKKLIHHGSVRLLYFITSNKIQDRIDPHSKTDSRTLKDVFDTLDITFENLTLDSLNVIV